MPGKIILIGNYLHDKQESMERFTQMLNSGFLKRKLSVEIWRPKAFFGKLFKSSQSGVGKWFGYIDKWIIFPLVLKIKLLKLKDSAVNFHICDHSNSPYLKHLPQEKTSITCHDVLAVRASMGHQDVHWEASLLGKVLQRWIIDYLRSAKKIAAVSHSTLMQLNQLSNKSSDDCKNWKVIHNALNASFKQIDIHTAKARLSVAGIDTGVPFLLHVGSSLPRKNRVLLIEMVHYLESKWDGQILFAGEGGDRLLMNKAKELNLTDRIVFVEKPSHDLLVALYNTCEAFIFPSFSEGFGWPVIEAQACGAPVICSNIQPMPEVSGEAAVHANPATPEDFAKAFVYLQNPTVRYEYIKKGFENIKRFDFEKMVCSYLELMDEK